MIWRGIRARLLLVALAPAILVAALLTAVSLHGRVSDLTEEHERRARALASQLAANAEFDLFSGNRSGLQVLANAILREQDIVGVLIRDYDGIVVARAGDLRILRPERLPGAAAPSEARDELRYVVTQEVRASEQAGDPLFEKAGGEDRRLPAVLGEVAIEMSKKELRDAERTLVVAGLVITALGLVFGALLALRLSRGVSRPLLELGRVVERVGRGELEARVQVREASPLRGLEDGVNRMAERLQLARDGLQQQIAEATTEMRAKKEEAEQANIAKSRFVAAASHDLRQPMHALGLFVDNLRSEVSGRGERERRLVEGMRHSIDAMAAMFDALLDISRLDAGVMPVNRVDFPVRRLLQQTAEMFAPLALQRGLRFSVVDSGAWVSSDPVLLERVLQNLVSNALKHTAAGGVVVGCRRLQDALSLQVWDSGPGISAENQQKIFQEFYQLGNAERDRTKGLGLGLAIVDRIARLLQHPLRVRSAPGRGSAFSIEVPYGVPVGAMEPVQMELPTDDFAGACVAVIDDDPASVEAMRGLLEQWDCTVVDAESDAQLLDALRGRGLRPQLVISDYRLRDGRTGIQAVERLRRELGDSLRALLVTGDTAPDRLLEATASGLELLHKPLAPERLKARLRELLIAAAPRARAGEP